MPYHRHFEPIPDVMWLGGHVMLIGLGRERTRSRRQTITHSSVMFNPMYPTEIHLVERKLK